MSKIKPEKKKKLGAKVVEWFPSQHSDPIKKAEQERGLQEFVDFLVPQSSGEIALSALPFGIGKFGKPVFKKGWRTARDVYNKWGATAPRQKELREHTWLDPMMEALKGKEWLKNWMKVYRGPGVDKLKQGIIKSDVDDVDWAYGIRPVDDPAAGWFSRDLTVYKKGMNPGAKGNKTGVIPGTVYIDEGFKNYDELWKYATNRKIPTKKAMKSLGVHEFTHAWHFGSHFRQGPMVDVIKKALKYSNRTQGRSVMPGARYWNIPQNEWRVLNKKRYDYLSEPREIWARIMQLRFELVQDPFDMAKGWVKLNRNLKKHPVYDDLKRVLSHESIEELYNNLPALLPLGAVPLAGDKIGKD